MKRSFPCPLCNSDLRADERLGGRQIRCSFCGGTIYVPNFAPSGESPDASSDATEQSPPAEKTAETEIINETPPEREPASELEMKFEQESNPESEMKSEQESTPEPEMKSEPETMSEIQSGTGSASEYFRQDESEEARALLNGPWTDAVSESDVEFEPTIISEPGAPAKIELTDDVFSQLIINSSQKKVDAAKKLLAEKESTEALRKRQEEKEKTAEKSSLFEKVRQAIGGTGLFGASRYKFNCPLCASELKATESQSGRQIRCAQCGGVIRVPHFESQEKNEVEPPFALKVEPQKLDTAPKDVSSTVDEIDRRIIERSQRTVENAKRSLAESEERSAEKEPAAASESTDSVFTRAKKTLGIGSTKREFFCPLCGSTLRAPESQSGRAIRCSYCAGSIHVPHFAPEGEVPAAPAPLETVEEPATPSLSALPSLLDTLSDSALDEKTADEKTPDVLPTLPVELSKIAEQDDLSRRIAERDRQKIESAKKTMAESAAAISERDFSAVTAEQVDLVKAPAAHLDEADAAKKKTGGEAAERRFVRLRNIFIVTYVGMYCFGAFFYMLYYSVEFGLPSGVLWSMVVTLLGLAFFNLILLVQIAWHVHGLIGLVLALGTRMVPFLNGIVAFYFCFRVGEEKKRVFDGVQQKIE